MWIETSKQLPINTAYYFVEYANGDKGKAFFNVDEKTWYMPNPIQFKLTPDFFDFIICHPIKWFNQ